MVDNLLETAYACLQSGDTEQAIAVGQELLKLKHARGFELIALAYEQQGKIDEAVAILKDGLQKVPKAWPLWELLGNIYSDEDSFADAQRCYIEALSCPNVDADSVQYNVAVLLKRQNKLKEALGLTERLNGEALGGKVPVLRLSILNAMQSYEAAIDLANRFIASLLAQPQVEDEDMPDLARAYAELARAVWENSRDRNQAWQHCWNALEWYRGEPMALALVREMINRTSPGSRWLKVIIEGRWYQPLEPGQPPPAFLSTYEVVSDTPEEALRYVSELEPVEVRASLKLDSFEDLGAANDSEQGVYWRSPYGFYI